MAKPEHTCSKCGFMGASLNEIRGNIRVICRQLERGVGPIKKAELQAEIAGWKARLKTQQEWLQEHIEEALYAPAGA